MGHVVGLYEDSDKPTGPNNRGFLHPLNNYQLLRNILYRGVK